MLHVEYTDTSKVKIASVFNSPQDVKYHPFYAEIDPSDERYAAYYHSLPEDMRRDLVTPTNA